MSWATVTITILAALVLGLAGYIFLLREEIHVLRNRLLAVRDTARTERQRFENADRLASRLASDLDAERAHTARLEGQDSDTLPLPHRGPQPGDPSDPLVEQLEQWLCVPAWLPPHEQPRRRRIRPATPPEDGGQPS